jgi:hypothetical protein
MMSLYGDLFIKIGTLLTTKEKIYLTMTCTQTSELKHVFKYHNRITINLIHNLPYFDNFESVEIFAPESKYPKHVKHIYFYYYGPLYNQWVPKSVTNLQFGPTFNKPIEKIIPHTVTHLTFGYAFDQPITNIPSSVTHLRVDYHFSHWNTIPDSVIEISTDGIHIFPVPDKLISRIKLI